MSVKSGFKRNIVLFCLLFVLQIPFTFAQVFHKNKGESQSVGSVSNGSLKNGYILPYRGNNFKYFSPFSYYILGRAYVHNKVCKTIMDTYKECEKAMPGIKFHYMECSKRKGGKMIPHRTHQNGFSADFMVPKIKKGKQSKFFDRMGILHYALQFDEKGRFKRNKKVDIDFESIANHILLLEKNARKNGLKIKKVIFKIDLKSELFATPSGEKLKQKEIYFARQLPKSIDILHDDHYHIDFELL